MKLFTFLFAASIIFVGMACGDDSSSTDSTEQTSPFDPASSESAPAYSGDVALNPPHGEPGHRCEIAVGAPLDGSAAPAATPTEQSPLVQPSPGAIAPAPISITPPAGGAPPAATAAGMNPPHGQPGHRCDIAVGAPLPK